MTESEFQTFEAVGAAVVVFDVDGRIVYWNQPCSDLTGYCLEEVRGRQFWDLLLVPEEVEPVMAVFTKLRATELPSRFENYWVSKTGKRRWIAWSNTLTTGPDGQVQYIIGTGIDRTDRKHAENVLRTAEARLGGIIEIAADAIISIDNEQRIAIYNNGAEKIFGWSAAEVMGKPLDILLPERFRDVHRQNVRSFGSGGVAARQMAERGPAIFGLRKNGEEFPAQAAISKLDVDGRMLLTVVLRDITQQKQREKEREFLAEVGAVLEATLDYDETLTSIARLVVQDLADCCIVDLVDRDGKLQRMKVLHRDPARTKLCEILQRIPLDRRRPYMVSSVVESKQPHLMAEVSSQYLESIAQGDEHLRALWELAPQSLIAVPLLAHGEPLGALVLVSSHPARRYGQEDLRLAEELAYRAALAIENARLYGNARRASQMRDDVLGIVAHDLRNPLNTVLMQASLLQRRRQEPDRQSQKPLEMIQRAAKRMNRLIQDLLDVTRIEAGRLSIEHKCVPAAQVILDAVDEQRLLASSALLDLRPEVPHELPDLWADRDRVIQVLENLVGNALKFTAPGGRVTIGAKPRDGKVLFWVADTGVGITPEDVTHLFDRFWQARRADRRGAGLGLPIVKGIVEAHGGCVWVESTLGRGSTFFFTIPTSHRAEEWRHQAAPQGP